MALHDSSCQARNSIRYRDIRETPMGQRDFPSGPIIVVLICCPCTKKTWDGKLLSRSEILAGHRLLPARFQESPRLQHFPSQTDHCSPYFEATAAYIKHICQHDIYLGFAGV